jgi:LPXTG-motif cell wall-anchored protein
MLKKISAGVLMALAFLMPAAPAAAEAGTPVLDEACQTVEPKVFTDLRDMITIDLDTANAGQVRILAYKILEAAAAIPLTVLPGRIEERLKGSEEDLRAFLKKDVLTIWMHDLRVAVGQAMTKGGANVKATANRVLDDGSIDALLAYLTKGLYAARALDCASEPTPKPSVTPSNSPGVTPSATTTATASANPSTTGSTDGEEGDGGEGGGLPVTGAAAETVAGVGGALLVLGGAGYLIGRRRRSRFEA